MIDLAQAHVMRGGVGGGSRGVADLCVPGSVASMGRGRCATKRGGLELRAAFAHVGGVEGGAPRIRMGTGLRGEHARSLWVPLRKPNGRGMHSVIGRFLTDCLRCITALLDPGRRRFQQTESRRGRTRRRGGRARVVVLRRIHAALTGAPESKPSKAAPRVFWRWVVSGDMPKERRPHVVGPRELLTRDSVHHECTEFTAIVDVVVTLDGSIGNHGRVRFPSERSAEIALNTTTRHRPWHRL